MEKYVIVLTAPSHHLMNDPSDYFKAYEIECKEDEIDYYVELKQREFCLNFKVALSSVIHLLTYRVKK